MKSMTRAAVFCAVLFLLAGSSVAQEYKKSDTTHEYLLAQWSLFSSAKPDQHVSVTVPTTVLGGLVDAGYFPFDPYQKMNMANIDPDMFAVPWIYQTQFRLDGDDSHALADPSTLCAVRLIFDGINYRGNLTVNSQIVASDKEFVGALRRLEYDITDLVRSNSGTANISVSLQRPGGQDRRNWRNPSTDLSVDFLDWTQTIPDLSMGLFRPVRVLFVNGKKSSPTPLLRFDGFTVRTYLSGAPPTHDLPASQIAYLNVSVEVTNIGSATLKAGAISIVFDLGDDLLKDADEHVQATVALAHDLAPNTPTRIVAPYTHYPQLVIPDPPLWYPFEIADQRPIFEAKIKVLPAGSSDPVECCRWDYALRSVDRRMTGNVAIHLYVNNIPVQIRGGGYVPDILYRIDRPRLVKELAMMRSMGLNGFRLEGMMMSSEFFSLADEMGLMALAGIACCDGWQNWADWPEENYAIAKQSVLTQAKRLGYHPSMALFLESSDDLPPERVERMYNEALEEAAWNAAIVSSADEWTSNVSGWSGIKMRSAYSWVPPSTWMNNTNPYLSNGRWPWAMDYGGAFGFLTEGGPGESPMTLNSWNRTVGPELIWNDTTGALDKQWSYHMGNTFGNFGNLSYYTHVLDHRFGVSNSASTYCYRSQVQNYEGIRAMFEAYARMRHVNATGLIQWQINKGWPSNLWTLYDYYGIGHGGFFGARGPCGGASAASAGIHIMMNPMDGSVFLMQTKYASIQFSHKDSLIAVAQVVDLQGKVLWHQQQNVFFVPSDGVIPLEDLTVPINEATLPELGNDTFFVRLSWSIPNSDSGPLATDRPFVTFGVLRGVLNDEKHPSPQWNSNWYWQTRYMDVVSQTDFDTARYFHVNASRLADMTGLNHLPTADLTVTAHSVAYSKHKAAKKFVIDHGAEFLWQQLGHDLADTHEKGSVFVVVVANGNAAPAFFTQLRVVNSSSGFDVGYCFYTQNFFSLMPSEKVEIAIHCPLANLSPDDAAASLHIEVDVYNNIVANSGASLIAKIDASHKIVMPKVHIPKPEGEKKCHKDHDTITVLGILLGFFSLVAITASIGVVFLLLLIKRLRSDLRAAQDAPGMNGLNSATPLLINEKDARVKEKDARVEVDDAAKVRTVA